MSTGKSLKETPGILSESKSYFKPIIFKNYPDRFEDPKLSIARQNLKKWMGRIVKVTLKNQLVLVGLFSCTDHDQNLVLGNCDKFMPNDDEPYSYGDVVVPGNRIEKFEVDMPKET